MSVTKKTVIFLHEGPKSTKKTVFFVHGGRA